MTAPSTPRSCCGPCTARRGAPGCGPAAGIVTDSMPDREFEETCEKLSSVAPYLVRSQG
ncbi:hypothetical protein ACQ4WX_05175 [Streptomyces lasalocidi]